MQQSVQDVDDLAATLTLGSSGRLLLFREWRNARWLQPLQPLKEPPATRFAKDQLRAFIERVERLEEEKKALADDIRDVFAEAKGTGFDVKALRAVLKLRKQDVDERREHETIVETYLHALGMLD